MFTCHPHISSGLWSWPGPLSLSLSTLACPPGSADGVIYCYQTLEHIKHFITCQSAASNSSPAGAAGQTKSARERERLGWRDGKRERKRKNDYALCQKAATGAGRRQALRVSVRQDLAGQAGTCPDKPGQTGSNRDKPALARTYRDRVSRDKPAG